MLGKIITVKIDRGFGFIRPAGGDSQSNHFFHATKLVGVALDESLVGREVEFESIQGEKGLRAVNVRLVD
jgi:cold shock CspA family protein